MVFEEDQRFNQWWLYVVMAVILAQLFYGTFTELKNYTETGEFRIQVIVGIVVLLLVLSLLMLKLKTRIDSHGIYANFSPIPFFTRKYSWKEIDEIYVRKYSALSEYGGWGIRGFGKAKAYNVSGNYGIQIVVKDGSKFLIGTNKPGEVKKFLEKKAHKNI